MAGMAGLLASPPLYAGHFLTTDKLLPCAKAYVVREQVGWLLQVSWLSIAFLAGAVFAAVAFRDYRYLSRRLLDVWGR